MKNKLYTYFFLAIFLAAQWGATLHNAHYAGEKHQHHGQTCDIWLSSEQSKTADLPPPPALPADVIPYFNLVSFTPFHLIAAEYAAALSRAPPAFLLS